MVSNTGAGTSDAPLFEETITRFWVLRQSTEVRHDGVYLRVAPFTRGSRRIALEDIDDATVTSYSASTYGGWHWGIRRTVGGNTVYRLRGDRGVELRLTDGTRVFVGSMDPTALHEAIAQRLSSQS